MSAEEIVDRLFDRANGELYVPGRIASFGGGRSANPVSLLTAFVGYVESRVAEIEAVREETKKLSE